jgi:hypothetical protein
MRLQALVFDSSVVVMGVVTGPFTGVMTSAVTG